MVTTLGVVAGAGLALVFVAFHFMKGTKSPAPEDIAQEVLEHRASTVTDTGFPEPYSRSIGGGGAAGAIAAGDADAELEEGDEEDAGFDPAGIPDDEVEYFEVEFVKEGETIEVANNENILDAGEDEGWDLPYACREGQCLSCGGHITNGDAHDFVQHSNNETLSDDEMEKGYVLTCTAYPTADFSLETNETP